MAHTNRLPGLNQLTTSSGSTDPLSISSQPSTGSAAPPSSPPQQSTEPGTPFSTGYAQDSDSEMAYSPPIATALLPGAPTSVDLMILTEFLNSQFKEAGKNDSKPIEAKRSSMQDFLHKGNYQREDIEAGFLHAVEIVGKAKKALQAAVQEVSAAGDASAVGDMVVGDEAEGFRYAYSRDVIAWEEVKLGTAQSLQTMYLHRGILQAYSAVAEIKIAIREVYTRQLEAQAEMQTGGDQDVEMEMDGANEEADEDASGIKVEAGSEKGGDEDVKMEVDSALTV